MTDEKSINQIIAAGNMVYCSVLESGNLVALRSKTDVVLSNTVNSKLVCFDPVRDRVYIHYYFNGGTVRISDNETLKNLMELRKRVKEKLSHV